MLLQILTTYYLAKSRSSTAVPNSISPSSRVYETVETPSLTTTSVFPSDFSKSIISPCEVGFDFQMSHSQEARFKKIEMMNEERKMLIKK